MTNLLLDTYIITKRIGSGSFGEVYMAIDMNNYNNVAIKIEERNNSLISKERLIYEYKIYIYLHKKGFNIGLPKVYDLFQTPLYNIMAMELLGKNLEELFIAYNKKLDINIVFYLALKLIDLLEKLHTNNYIHRDIKPSNFLLSADNKELFIMDFGLSKRYRFNNKHIKLQLDRNFVGTARYASINIHNRIEPSRRDDLESVGYMLVYFLKGQLPWQGLRKQIGVKHTKIIGDVKISTSINNLCSGLPMCLKKYLLYVRNLKFDEAPDYKYMNNLFINYIDENKLKFTKFFK